MPVLSFMFMVNSLNLTILRNRSQALIFGLFEIAHTIISIGVTVLLLIMFTYGWYSRAIGITVAYSLFFIISLLYLRDKKYLSLNIDNAQIKSILILSIPLIPHALGNIVITMSDRLFIEKMINLEMVGIYSVGYMFGMVVMLFTDAFLKAWSPWFYKNLTKATALTKRKIVKYSYLYIIGVFILAIIISAVAEVILPYIVNNKFHDAKQFILWIALGYAVQGIYKIFFPYLVHINKTSFLAFSTVIAALINLIFNYLLISFFGAIGAAYATILAFSVSSLLVFWYQKNRIAMPWALNTLRDT